MIEKEEWMSRHKNDEKEWEVFKQYCLNCGFKFSKQNGKEVIFAPSYESGEEEKNADST